MPTFIFDKLIRDNILEEHIKEGHDIKYRILEGTDLKDVLRKKLHEESDEIPIREKADDEIIEEIGDVQQILDDLMAEYDITHEQVAEAMKRKFDKKGGFRRGVHVDTVTVDESDKWVQYYRASPDKYPEVRS